MHDKNKPQRPRRGASLDGIVPDGRSIGVPAHRSYRPAQGSSAPANLGDLAQRKDGFHPMRQSGPVSLDELPDETILDEPIVLDDDASSGKKKHSIGLDRSGRKASKSHKHFGVKKLLKRGGLLAGTIVLLTAAYLGYKFYNTQKQVLSGGGNAPAVCDGEVPVDKLKKEGDSRVNILLLGIGGEGHEGADLTDTIMIASLDPVNDKMDLVSIPRDLWVKIPNHGSRKVNEAYYFGKQQSKSTNPVQQQRDGVSSMDQTLEKVLDIPIHYNAVINFKAFQDMVNALGGVDLNVTQDESVYEVLWIEGTSRHYTLDVKPGLQHFDGTRALYFARSRYTSAEGDFDRSQRQRALMVAIKEKALSAGTYSNPLKISQLMDSLGSNVYTDFDNSSIKCLYTQISQVPAANITSLDLVTEPHALLTSGDIPGVSTLVPKQGTFQYGAIQAYIHNALRDSFLAKENAKVAIYNATNFSGLATTQSDKLKPFGYNITTVDSLPTATNPETTTIVDLSGGANKYTRNYLEQRYGIRAVISLPAGLGVTPPPETQFVIILGKDVATSAN